MLSDTEVVEEIFCTVAVIRLYFRELIRIGIFHPARFMQQRCKL
jgi:hypothetical protein